VTIWMAQTVPKPSASVSCIVGVCVIVRTWREWITVPLDQIADVTRVRNLACYSELAAVCSLTHRSLASVSQSASQLIASGRPP